MVSITMAAILLLYCLFLIWLIVGWRKTKSIEHKCKEPKFYYSVIVPFRNEASHLPELIRSLSELDFPADRFEIILVDDHSSDEYEVNINNFENISILKLSNGEGKKAALNYAIGKAKGEVIITTDADCLVPKDWLRYYAFLFEEKEAKLAFGGVSFKGVSTFFQKLQQVEFSSLIGSGAATLSWGFPTMSNGANFAFFKHTFEKVGGYEDNLNIPSGDDEFLLHKIYAQYPQSVYFIKNKNVVVETSPAKDLSLFFSQRKRWASKWKYYSGIKNSLLAVLVFVFNVIIIASLALLIINFDQFKMLLVPLILKMILEGLFLQNVLKYLNVRFYFLPFIFLQITYPLYAVIFGITANFGQYNWKGRKHKL